MEIQLARAAELSRRMGGRKGAPVRRSFVQSANGSTPLSQIMSGRSARKGGGGRGGKTRVAVLISLLWVLAAAPHASNRPARFWAELIGLDDPGTAGARTVSSSLTELEKRGFITLDHSVAGSPPTVQLLSENANGAGYTLPGAAAKKGHVDPYFRVPEYLWTGGAIGTLSGPGLAMYLVVLSVHRNDIEDHRIWFAPATFKSRFGLGDSTKKTGLRELVDAGILTDYIEPLDQAGETGNRTYSRKTYRLDSKYA
ncbi:hypothetical protein ACFRJ8_19835 [Arthrobacter sp. NPDC056886]|uniref:hypothetical protein n=1 Tax=Arthrobacter sp. NPDC056886 TaxID=3345960 RepID=UPI003670015F